MSFENPLENSGEAPEQRAEQYQKEAEVIVQRLSQVLSGAMKKDPTLQAKIPKLAEIDTYGGIQKWFESQVKFIEVRGKSSADARSRMMYRVKEDLEHIENQVDSAI